MTLTDRQRAALHFALFRRLFPAAKLRRAKWTHILTPHATYPSRRDAERGAYSAAQRAITHDDYSGEVVDVAPFDLPSQMDLRWRPDRRERRRPPRACHHRWHQ